MFLPLIFAVLITNRVDAIMEPMIPVESIIVPFQMWDVIVVLPGNHRLA